MLYRQSIHYGLNLDSTFIFQYDQNTDYQDILLLRINNYVFIGEIDSALFYYNIYGNNFGFECTDTNINNIIDCIANLDSNSF